MNNNYGYKESYMNKTFKVIGIIVIVTIISIGFFACKNGTIPCIHTGGEANCTLKAVCTICNEEYGDFLHSVENWSILKHPTSLYEVNHELGEESGTCEICASIVIRRLTIENYKTYFLRPPENPGPIKNSTKGLPYYYDGDIAEYRSAEDTVFTGLGGLATGTDIVLWRRRDYIDLETDNQAWRFIPDINEDYFQIKSDYFHFSYLGDRVIKLNGTTAEEGMGLILAFSNVADDSQWWRLLRQSDDSFIIISKTNPSLGIAVMSEIPPSSDEYYWHNFPTMQPLDTANNIWIFEPYP